MATSQLFGESFAYGRPMNSKSSGDDRHRHLPFAAARDTDAAGFSSRSNWGRATSDDFDLSHPKSESSSLVHADQILSKSFSRPVQTPTAPQSPLTSRQPATSNYAWPKLGAQANSTTNTCSSTVDLSSSWKLKLHLLGSCLKSSKKTMQRFLSLLMPSYKKAESLSLSSSKSSWSCKDSSQGSCSSKTSNSFSNMQWCRSNADISIHDAILHCKKSIGLEGD